MLKGAFIAAGVVFWTAGLLFAAIGMTKIARMDRRKFRYDLDMDRSRNEIWRTTAYATTAACMIGTALVVAGNL